MYIIKNALLGIGRSKGRNILIGIIALVIAVSACIGLSIRLAAESAKASALVGMTVTATISYDRAGAMNQMGGGLGQSGGFDRGQFAGMMGNASTLTLEEYQKYATAESVKDEFTKFTVVLPNRIHTAAVTVEDGAQDGRRRFSNKKNSDTHSAAHEVIEVEIADADSVDE